MKRTVVTALALAFLAILVFSTGCWEVFCPIDEEPVAVIDKPRLQGAGTQSYATTVTFRWHCEPECKPMSVRYLCDLVRDANGVYSDTFDVVRDLNRNPSRYEDRWSDWIRYDAPDDAGRHVKVDGLTAGKKHFFAVQARSYCDHVTTLFQLNKNIRRFVASVKVGPLLTVGETYLGYSRFIGTTMTPVKYDLPGGVPLNFRWEADAEEYGGEIVCYRYGWDVQDINDPSDWDVECAPFHTAAPTRTLYSGVHTLYIEAVDNGNKTTRAAIQINIIPFAMDRTLLWVDDFFSIDPQPPMYETPGESNHDAFWVDICSRAGGFDPGRDVYDCFYGHSTHPPTIQEIGKYKNIIWTYSTSQDAWRKVVEFTPESHIGSGQQPKLNYLPVFLARGGHLWTLGRSENVGGLAAIWKESRMPLWPATFMFDMSYNPSDTSGVHCMGYRDYCVSAIDKIWGSFKSDPGEVPPNYIRDLTRDGMRYAYKDDTDFITAQYPGLPVQLDLWEEVTKPGRFFDPQIRGFMYCEIYDPQYYMDFYLMTSQHCFHPIYRMKARSSLSFINDQTIAIWVTRYEDIVPDVQAGIGVAARSVHFGFPLWFFDRTAVDEIVEVVFDEWQILVAP
jgi:hypothetical protein